MGIILAAESRHDLQANAFQHVFKFSMSIELDIVIHRSTFALVKIDPVGVDTRGVSIEADVF
jgi:hypothetical protein